MSSATHDLPRFSRDFTPAYGFSEGEEDLESQPPRVELPHDRVVVPEEFSQSTNNDVPSSRMSHLKDLNKSTSPSSDPRTTSSTSLLHLNMMQDAPSSVKKIVNIRNQLMLEEGGKQQQRQSVEKSDPSHCENEPEDDEIETEGYPQRSFCFLLQGLPRQHLAGTVEAHENSYCAASLRKPSVSRSFSSFSQLPRNYDSIFLAEQEGAVRPTNTQSFQVGLRGTNSAHNIMPLDRFPNQGQ